MPQSPEDRKWAEDYAKEHGIPVDQILDRMAETEQTLQEMFGVLRSIDPYDQGN